MEERHAVNRVRNRGGGTSVVVPSAPVSVLVPPRKVTPHTDVLGSWLQEARRLLRGADLDAASAASRLGYNDASHFHWEYKCLFGDPPMRDVQRLWEAASAVPSR
jgi:hypothetical protein